MTIFNVRCVSHSTSSQIMISYAENVSIFQLIVLGDTTLLFGSLSLLESTMFPAEAAVFSERVLLNPPYMSSRHKLMDKVSN